MEELEEMLKLVAELKEDKEIPAHTAVAMQLQILSLSCQYRMLEGIAVQNGQLERIADALDAMARKAKMGF